MKCVIDHLVLNVQDEEKMIAFYGDILKFSTDRLDEYRSGKVPFPSVRPNAETIIDLFPKKMWERQAGAGSGRENLNHFCIALSKSNWQKLMERLQAHAVPTKVGPVERWGAHGIGISVYFRDPEDNLTEAKYYEVVDTQGARIDDKKGN